MALHSRKTRRSTAKKTKKRGPKRVILIIVGVLIAIVGVGAGAAFALSSVWLQNLPDYEDVSAYNYAEKTRVYASDGTTLLAEFYVENREPIELDEMGTYVTEGTVATEDERYYDHGGVDLVGIVRAAWVNLTHTGHEGASTITQQFVRNTVLSEEATENTIKRKVREAYIALKLEEMYSKDEILEMYLNTINYGQGAYGIEAASQRYFSKSAKDLTLAEAAALIGIPQAPSHNNPIDNPDNCLSRRNLVLDRMLSNGYISQEEHDAAQAEPLELSVTHDESNNGIIQYDYFTSFVREELLEDYSVNDVFKGGLTVITTLDPSMQNLAEEAVNRKLASLPSNLECALVAIDPDNGFIRAMVGGKDYNTNQFNLATQAQRQPGSSFKTFTLLTALNEGISPEANLNCSSVVQLGNWTVHNYGNANYGTRSIRSAYAVSSNTGFAGLINEVGPEKVVEMAHTCGIESDLSAVPSLTLGSEEVNVTEMAQAYATIANGGTFHEAQCISQIKDSQGNTIFNADTAGQKVLDTDLTAAAVDVMKGVVTNGTGRNARLSSGQPVAGKTGTSQEYRDKWFCGITPQLSVAIWIGGREETSMPTWVAADSVFGDFVGKALAGSPIEQFPTGSGQMKFTRTDIGFGSGSSGSGEVTAEGEAPRGSNSSSDRNTAIDQSTNQNSSKPNTGTNPSTSKPDTGTSGSGSGGTSGSGGSGGTSGSGSGGTSGSGGGSSSGGSGDTSGSGSNSDED